MQKRTLLITLGVLLSGITISSIGMSVSWYSQASDILSNDVEISLASDPTLLIGLKDVPNFILKENQKLLDILIDNEICSSRREVREFLASGSITINGEKATDEEQVITKEMAIENKIIVIRRGKKKNYIGKFED